MVTTLHLRSESKPLEHRSARMSTLRHDPLPPSWVPVNSTAKCHALACLLLSLNGPPLL